MRELDLPDNLQPLVEHLQIAHITWHGVAFQLPRFAIYSVIPNPVCQRYMFRDGKRIGLMKLKRYWVPLVDPLQGTLDEQPAYAVVVSHCKGNRFGLYAYPADYVNQQARLRADHPRVSQLVAPFV
ncbi:hypothetical protein LJ739_16600 [Aestuariibacter halophilus]|uniref:Uncharacterized protein n=1 Tax=Fluctibacter halophilus TaxID=226011 RepID=A0ABS8GDI8_9ALTE|nr:hypothetical protein [Aestuariibacter halophilus]MCC2617874.1 hypothetical protein [Aestuariibacter halophilus]